MLLFNVKENLWKYPFEINKYVPFITYMVKTNKIFMSCWGPINRHTVYLFIYLFLSWFCFFFTSWFLASWGLVANQSLIYGCRILKMLPPRSHREINGMTIFSMVFTKCPTLSDKLSLKKQRKKHNVYSPLPHHSPPIKLD
jgi:hypothetical protein